MRAILRFTKDELEVPKRSHLSPARFIQTFDVISEVNCVLRRRWWWLKYCAIPEFFKTSVLTDFYQHFNK